MSFGAAESAAFQVSAGEEVIYAGEAFRRPGASELSVRLNDICSDFLANPLPDIDPEAPVTQAAPDLVRVFGVQLVQGSLVSSVGAVEFSRDWSYDPEWPLTGLANDPIVPLLDYRQRLVLTSYTDASRTVYLDRTGGAGSLSVAVGGSGGPYNASLNMSRNVLRARCGDLTWSVGQTCARHALYYLNAHGGWDTMLMRGASSQSDGVERSEAWRDYDNADPRNRGRVNWRNAVTRTWTMHTGWLTDAQAAKMHHLLESTDVDLLDLDTQELRAVVLTDADAPVKTYKGEGRRLVDYTVTAQCAQDMERR